METLANCQLIFSGFLFYGGKLNHYVNRGNYVYIYIILMVALPNIQYASVKHKWPSKSCELSSKASGSAEMASKKQTQNHWPLNIFDVP